MKYHAVDLEVDGDSRMHGNLSVDGNLSILGNLYIEGVTFADGGILLDGDIDMNDNDIMDVDRVQATDTDGQAPYLDFQTQKVRRIGYWLQLTHHCLKEINLLVLSTTDMGVG